jgi:glucosamine--fructose-6-phosphate aminotransferase (isomerizing)
VHGIEEVMNADDVVIWVDPYEDSEASSPTSSPRRRLTVIAISDRQTSFPTIRVPKSELSSYVSMAAGGTCWWKWA